MIVYNSKINKVYFWGWVAKKCEVSSKCFPHEQEKKEVLPKSENAKLFILQSEKKFMYQFLSHFFPNVDWGLYCLPMFAVHLSNDVFDNNILNTEGWGGLVLIEGGHEINYSNCLVLYIMGKLWIQSV